MVYTNDMIEVLNEMNEKLNPQPTEEEIEEMARYYEPITEEEKEEILEWEYQQDLMNEPYDKECDEPYFSTKRVKEYEKFDENGDYIDCPYFWKEKQTHYID